MGRRHPAACGFVLDHLASVEALLDVAIITGFSFGLDKAVVLQTQIQLLGSVVGREGREATEEHVRSIVEWGDLADVSAVRQFLGA